jgi:hypothetical protein
MHFNLHFTTVEILWTLTFAAQLVLLVVLIGRDRARQFPWFTISIVLMALRLLASRLLYGRMAGITLSAIFVVMADVAAVAGFLVVVEMGRNAFRPVKRGKWLAGALVLLVAGGGILAEWGPWPALKTLTADSFLASLRLMQFLAQKLDMLVDLLTVMLGIVVAFLGRRYGAGWKSHTQRILTGLATASAGQLAVEGIWQIITKTAVPQSHAEYDRIMALRDRLFNANGALYIAVLVWWIIVLWMDEPGMTGGELPLPERAPEYLIPEVDLPEGGLEPEVAGEAAAG